MLSIQMCEGFEKRYYQNSMKLGNGSVSRSTCHASLTYDLSTDPWTHVKRQQFALWSPHKCCGTCLPSHANMYTHVLKNKYLMYKIKICSTSNLKLRLLCDMCRYNTPVSYSLLKGQNRHKILQFNLHGNNLISPIFFPMVINIDTNKQVEK